MPGGVKSNGKESGFTLIELSIVLVIIGLIVGGVLVGQDLIKAAEVRATISQIEKYNTAVNTFYGKYDALPGDMNATVASTFGFTPRGQYAGEGDGNGVIQGVEGNNAGDENGNLQFGGETVMFWVDLTTANGLNLNLIDGSFSAASPTNPVAVSGTQLATFFPQAKLGRGNYIYVISGGMFAVGNNGLNYYAMSALWSNYPTSNFTMTVQQAYNIDKKMDDGFPMTGRVVASFLQGDSFDQVPSGSTDSAGTCYNTSTAAGVYSLSSAANGGSGPNCGLLFQFQ